MRTFLYGFFIIVLAFLVFPFTGKASKVLSFYYIAHDHNEYSIEDALKRARDRALSSPDETMFFYLANDDSPLLMRVGNGDQKQFEEFIETLKSSSEHSVSSDVDKMQILQLFSKDIAFGDFDRIVLNFYINPDFVRRGFCESIIGRLFWDLELDGMPSSRLEINLFHHFDDEFNYSAKVFDKNKYLGSFPYNILSFQ